MNTAPLRVIGYVRVSTNRQDLGPLAQIEALEAKAAAEGWDLTIVREDAASAKSMSKRPVLAAALADLKAGKADALAVSKLDRLSRNVADFSAMLNTAARERWALICLDLNVDTTTITGAAMAQIICTFAEMERKRIGERTREGMAKLPAGQKRRIGRQSQQDPATLARIVERHREGHSLSRIARDLTADGVPTAAGGKWHPVTIRKVLDSRAGKEYAAGH